jgi:hypothetical protein
MELKDMRWWRRSTLKLAEVLVLTFGYHNPAALIIVLKYLLLALNSVSMSRTEPHSAKLLKPSEAICPSPQKLKFFSCEAPMTSEKCVNHRENGKSFGWVLFDQIPSNII